jgi:hypothetical protein
MAIFRPAVISRRIVRVGLVAVLSQGSVTANLLTTTLSGPNVKPFTQSNWQIPASRPHFTTTIETRPSDVADGQTFTPVDAPIPRVRTVPIQHRTWTAGPQPVASTAVPFVPDELFPVPRRGSSNSARLCSITEFYAVDDSVQNPFQSTVQENPRGRVLQVQPRTWTVSLQSSTLAPASVSKPFAQTDWPTPAVRNAGAISRRTFIGYYVYNVEEEEPPPDEVSAVLRAPLILRHRKVVRPFKTELPRNILLLNSAQARPFTSGDWPAPRRRDRPVSMLTMAVSRSVEAATPFVSLDWALPSRHKYLITTRTITSSGQALLTPPVVTNALFRRTDYRRTGARGVRQI